MYCYVWTYVVKPARVQEFRLAYGQQGEWVRLFREDPAYDHTDLLGDRDNPGRFMTIDYWSSREACRAFRERHAQEFEGLDSRFAEFTEEEIHLGDFDLHS